MSPRPLENGLAFFGQRQGSNSWGKCGCAEPDQEDVCLQVTKAAGEIKRRDTAGGGSDPRNQFVFTRFLDLSQHYNAALTDLRAQITLSSAAVAAHTAGGLPLPAKVRTSRHTLQGVAYRKYPSVRTNGDQLTENHRSRV